MKAFHGMALGALLLAGCNDRQASVPTDDAASANFDQSNVAQRPGHGPDNAAAIAAEPTSATDYLAKAGAGDLFEIESSKAILAKNPDKAIKDFAQTMIDAHSQSTATLKAAANAARMTVAPPSLNADQQAKLNAIRTAMGEVAQTDYLSAQRDAHAAALALHQNYAAHGDTPQLKAAAGQIVPVIQHHIDMLAKLPTA